MAVLIITIAIGLGTLVVVILSLITTENAYGQEQEQEQEKQSDNNNNKLNLQRVNGNLSATVNKVLAGDKITVNLADGQTMKVRLSLIDIPEQNKEGWREAKEAVEDKCKPGADALVDIDEGQNKFFGNVAQVFCKAESTAEDATVTKYWLNINEYLVKAKYAKGVSEYCHYSTFKSVDWSEDICNNNSKSFIIQYDHRTK